MEPPANPARFKADWEDDSWQDEEVAEGDDGEPIDWGPGGGEIVTVVIDGEAQEGVIVGEDLGEAEEAGPGRLAEAAVDDRERSEWSTGRLQRLLAGLEGDRPEDAPVMARAPQVRSDGSGTADSCASQEFRGALLCGLR